MLPSLDVLTILSGRFFRIAPTGCTPAEEHRFLLG
jgi:hypothetical protein